MTQGPGVAPTPSRGRRWLVLAALALLLAVALVVGLYVGSMREGGDAAPTDAAERPVPSETPSGSPAPSEEPVPAGPVIPASCDEVYTRDWSAELGGLVLNPAWTEDPEMGPFWGSSDVGAITVLEATTALTCSWVSPNGGGDVGIITNLANVSAEQQSSTIDHLAGAGHSCYEELEGVRCVIEWGSEAGVSGESHFFREGIWSATRWANLSADGYTHDIAATIFD